MPRFSGGVYGHHIGITPKDEEDCRTFLQEEFSTTVTKDVPPEAREEVIRQRQRLILRCVSNYFQVSSSDFNQSMRDHHEKKEELLWPSWVQFFETNGPNVRLFKARKNFEFLRQLFASVVQLAADWLLQVPLAVVQGPADPTSTGNNLLFFFYNHLGGRSVPGDDRTSQNFLLWRRIRLCRRLVLRSLAVCVGVLPLPEARRLLKKTCEALTYLGWPVLNGFCAAFHHFEPTTPIQNELPQQGDFAQGSVQGTQVSDTSGSTAELEEEPSSDFALLEYLDDVPFEATVFHQLLGAKGTDDTFETELEHRWYLWKVVLLFRLGLSVRKGGFQVQAWYFQKTLCKCQELAALGFPEMFAMPLLTPQVSEPGPVSSQDSTSALKEANADYFLTQLGQVLTIIRTRFEGYVLPILDGDRAATRAALLICRMTFSQWRFRDLPCFVNYFQDGPFALACLLLFSGAQDPQNWKPEVYRTVLEWAGRMFRYLRTSLLNPDEVPPFMANLRTHWLAFITGSSVRDRRAVYALNCRFLDLVASQMDHRNPLRDVFLILLLHNPFECSAGPVLRGPCLSPFVHQLTLLLHLLSRPRGCGTHGTPCEGTAHTDGEEETEGKEEEGEEDLNVSSVRWLVSVINDPLLSRLSDNPNFENRNKKIKKMSVLEVLEAFTGGLSGPVAGFVEVLHSIMGEAGDGLPFCPGNWATEAVNRVDPVLQWVKERSMPEQTAESLSRICLALGVVGICGSRLKETDLMCRCFWRAVGSQLCVDSAFEFFSVFVLDSGWKQAWQSSFTSRFRWFPDPAWSKFSQLQVIASQFPVFRMLLPFFLAEQGHRSQSGIHLETGDDMASFRAVLSDAADLMLSPSSSSSLVSLDLSRLRSRKNSSKWLTRLQNKVADGFWSHNVMDNFVSNNRRWGYEKLLSEWMMTSDSPSLTTNLGSALAVSNQRSGWKSLPTDLTFLVWSFFSVYELGYWVRQLLIMYVRTGSMTRESVDEREGERESLSEL
jgi:hypothetical protein